MEKFKLFILPLLVLPFLINCNNGGGSSDVTVYTVTEEEFNKALSFQDIQYMQRYECYIDNYKMTLFNSCEYSPTRTKFYTCGSNEINEIYQKIDNNIAYIFDDSIDVWEEIPMEQFISVEKNEPIAYRLPDFPKYNDFVYDTTNRQYNTTIEKTKYELFFENKKIVGIRTNKTENEEILSYICSYTYHQVEPFIF